MKYIKLYESFEDIDSICKKYRIKNYTINSDGTIDGNVTGDFYCNTNKLTTLEGTPQSVGGDFSCRNNRLISLEGCPQSVGGYFNFRSNQLKDLYGFPEFFDGNIYYSVNPVSEILYLFPNRLVKVIELLNEYNVIRQNGKLVILDRLEEVFHTLNMDIPKEINLKNYEVD